MASSFSSAGRRRSIWRWNYSAKAYRLLVRLPNRLILPKTANDSGGLLNKLNIPQPNNGNAVTLDEARLVARNIGYPILVRPSYVLGGRAMVVVYDEAGLDNYMHAAVSVSRDRPVLIDKFLEDAYEVDVDALCDGEQVRDWRHHGTH
jgi:carbamoyl-phosphate synthase large subunit